MADYSLALVVILQVLVLGYQFYATLGVSYCRNPPATPVARY